MKTYDLIQQLNLAPLPGEGGYFRRTYEGAVDENGRAAHSVIYYLLTPEQPRSKLHKLPISETYHFYLGGPVQMLILHEDGSSQTPVLGQDIAAGQHVQLQVPAHCWHGSMLCPSADFALMGTQMCPGYVDADYVPADQKILQNTFAAHQQLIAQLT